MAIEYTVMIQKNIINEKFILDKFDELGYQYEKKEMLENGTNIISFQKNLGFIVYLSKEKKYPRNIWDTIFQKDEYKFAQTISFRIEKNFSDFELLYTTIFNTIFKIIDEFSINLLLIGNGGNELLFFSKEAGLLLNNKIEMWNKPIFENLLKEKNYRYLVN